MADATTRRAARTATLIALPAALLAGLGGYWAMGGFRASPAKPPTVAVSGPVDVAAPALAGRTADVCRALLAKLPDKLAELPRRPVRTGSEQNAAYGDPPVTIACGTAGPSVPPDGQLFVLSTVCWYAEQRADAAVWTLQNREVPMTVTVPGHYSGPSRFVIALSAPITSAVPSAPGRCN
jgi:hypothetical protein